jgi:hypothetical protein
MRIWWIVVAILLALTAIVVVLVAMPQSRQENSFAKPIDADASRLSAKKDILCVTCWYGEETPVYGAPQIPTRKIFFTNNPSMIQAIVAAGWEPVLVHDKMFARDVSPHEPPGSRPPGKHAAGIGVSSLQSKQIKFLQFPAGYADLVRQHDLIVYMDHKRIVSDVPKLVRAHTADILVRLDKKLKNIDQEIRMASYQPRYSRRMKKTASWVKEQQSGPVKIMNTGVIVYNTTATVQKFCREVFETCLRLEQPECQIVWAVLAQKYEKSPFNLKLKVLKYHDVPTRPVFL